MTTGDWIGVAVGIGGLIASILLGIWNNRIALAQNEIFREQNRIFAAQAGIKMPEPIQQKRRLGLYWPALIALILSIAVGLTVARLQIFSPKPIGAIASALPWTLAMVLAFGAVQLRQRLKGSLTSERTSLSENAELKRQIEDLKRPVSLPPSKLVIQSADYRAIAQGGNTCDVTECLRKMINGDSLILQIENHNFIVDGNNYVPVDPYYGESKRLRVVYYFDGGSPRVAERPEHKQIVLPEDTFLIEHCTAIQHQAQLERNQSNAELSRAREAYRQCEEERKKVLQSDGNPKMEAILNPLQTEAFAIAKDLRDFIASMPPYPSGPTQNPGEDDHTFMVRHISEQSTLRRKWDQKLKHAYANRGIGPRVTSFLHRFAEAFDDAPVGNASYAEDLGFSTDDKTIPKLAQQMEMIAIWINRKERGEVNLLS